MLQKLNQAIEYIEIHLTDDLSLQEISHHVGVSDYHLSTEKSHQSAGVLPFSFEVKWQGI